MYNRSSKFFTYKNKISVLINIIIGQYFGTSRCLIVLTDYHISYTYTTTQQIINFPVNTSNSSLKVDQFITDGYHGCQNFIIHSFKPLDVFEQIEDGIRHSLARFNQRRYLFILEQYEINLNVLFNSKAFSYVADLLIINPKNYEIFELWRHDYVGKKNNNFLRKVDIWFSVNSSFLVGSILYPNKLLNQKGRTIKLGCFKYVPYSLCDPKIITRNFYGMELKLVAEYLKYHNLTPHFVFNDVKEEYWGALYPNWTGSGLMGKVLNDEADIAFTAFYTWEFVYHYLDLSKSYIRTGISCLVPKPRKRSGWFIPISPYRTSLWIVVFIDIIYNIIISFVLTTFRQKLFIPRDILDKRLATFSLVNTVWVIIKISLGQNLEKKEKFIIVHHVLLVLTFQYLILDSAYYSGLAATMTVPRYERPINTALDLANGDVTIWGIFEDWVLSIKNIDDVIYNKITKKFRAVNEAELRELTKHDYNAFFMERLPYNNYGINDFMKADVIENYHLMEEDVYWEYTLFFLRKSSILTPSFDEFLLRVIESGLPYAWQKLAVYEFMDLNIQKLAAGLDSKKTHRGIQKLTLFHIKGSLAVLFIGFFLAMMSLALEIYVHTRKQKQRINSIKGYRKCLVTSK